MEFVQQRAAASSSTIPLRASPGLVRHHGKPHGAGSRWDVDPQRPTCEARVLTGPEDKGSLPWPLKPLRIGDQKPLASFILLLHDGGIPEK